MALQLSYQLTLSRSFFEACKPKRNIQHILEAKTRQNHLILCGAKSKVYQADSRLPIYQPTIWSHDLIQVLHNNFRVNFEERVRELEKKVVIDYLNNGCFRTLELLEHIDDIERLGLGYRFQSHIQRLLDVITSLYEINDEHDEKKESLHEASLRFRILRQHGYNVSQGTLLWFFISISNLQP
ncbi:putative (E)-beta-ocimene synthase [Helianthus anomalus]